MFLIQVKLIRGLSPCRHYIGWVKASAANGGQGIGAGNSAEKEDEDPEKEQVRSLFYSGSPAGTDYAAVDQIRRREGLYGP